MHLRRMPKPKGQLPGLESSKKISEKSSNNFPAGNTRNRESKILPSHRAIFENYKEQGFRNLGKAIRKTKVYSESVASRVNIITKSSSWKALMKEYMPEEVLAQRHAEILDKRDTKIVTEVDADGKKTAVEVDDGPNTAAVTKGLELAYKLRGSFKEKEAPPPSTVMYNLFYKPEVREQTRVFEEGIKLSLQNEVAKKNKRDIREEAENQALLDGEAVEEDSDGD